MALQDSDASIHDGVQGTGVDLLGRERAKAVNLRNEPQHRDVTWEQVMEEESQCIERLRSFRTPEPSGAGGSWRNGDDSSKRFSLAFSGGGIRAAAFQAGVLWRLAKEDRLKDVDYFVAVSGGGYITSAFASHCLDEEPPREGESSRDWYLKVVAKTICRMQTNGGNFVRECWGRPSKGEEGAGKFPRWLDFPVLLAILAVTLLVGPLSFIIGLLVPMTIMVDLFFGPMLRAAYCDSKRDTGGAFQTVAFFWDHSPVNALVYFFMGLCVLTFALFVLRMCSGGLRLLPPEKVGGRPTAPWGFQAAHAAQAFFVRITALVLFLVIFVFLLNYIQSLGYTDAQRSAQCWYYVHGNITAGVSPGYITDSLSANCSNTYPPGSRTVFWEWTDYSLINIYNESKNEPLPDVFDHTGLSLGFWGFLASMFGILASVTCCFCLLMPCLGGGLMIWFMANIIGPALVTVASLCFCEFSIYGPITKNAQGSFLYWHPTLWKDSVYAALVVVLGISMFFEEIKGVLHSYYKRSLRQNFFSRGKDIRFSDLADRTKGGARMCPFVLLTVTASDYQPPGEKDTISELSLSSIHCGGEETGYIRQPPWFSLGKSTALTGAGCLDAIALSASDQISLRFWLEFLSLSWGDYILFEGKSRLYDFAERMGEKYHSDAVGRLMVRIVHRAPAGVMWLLFYTLQLFAFSQMVANDAHSCRRSADLFWVSTGVFIFVLFASFFSFCTFFDLFSLSTISRLILQATKYHYVGNKPPRMLYVTDGGVKDCTGVLQLMMRRRERIVLALAGADRTDDLEVLRTAMETAQQLKIGSFFDPEHPQRSVSVLLDKFKKDTSIGYLHIGICYSWSEEAGGTKTGDLYIVKHRLPDGFEGMPVQPLLTEAEIIGGQTSERGEAPDRLGMEDWGDLTTDQLGPYGCCDCWHTRGWNCGNPFPHGAFSGYLYLTPMWVNSLARLGFGASKAALTDCFATWQSGARTPRTAAD